MECKSLLSFHLFGMCLRYLREAAEKRVAFLLLFLGVGLVQPCGGASVGFENTGNLATARSFQTATLRSGERDLGSDRQPRHCTRSSHGDVAAQRQGARRRRL